MKKIVSKIELNYIVSGIKADLLFCINNIEYREKIINLLENSIKNNIEKYKRYNIIDSHKIISDFIQIDDIYSLSYRIYNDIEIKRSNEGNIKNIIYKPYAASFGIYKYNCNYFYNNYSIDPNSFTEENNHYMVRKNKIVNF